MQVGFTGIGEMGPPIARNLGPAGHQVAMSRKDCRLAANLVAAQLARIGASPTL